MGSSIALRPEMGRLERQNSLGSLSVTEAGQPGTVTDARCVSGCFKWRETRPKASQPHQLLSSILHHSGLSLHFAPLGKSARMRRLLQNKGSLENRITVSISLSNGQGTLGSPGLADLPLGKQGLAWREKSERGIGMI